MTGFNGLIVTCLKQSVPLRDAFKEDFEYMRAWAENNARPASSTVEGEDTGGTQEVAPPKRKVRKRVRKGEEA